MPHSAHPRPPTRNRPTHPPNELVYNQLTTDKLPRPTIVQGAAIGDIFISSAVVNHDRRIPLPSFDAYGLGKKDTHACPNLVKELGLKTGVVSSGRLVGLVGDAVFGLVLPSAEGEGKAGMDLCRLAGACLDCADHVQG